MNSTLLADGSAIATLQTGLANDITNITAIQAQTQYISTGIDINGFPATFISNCNVWVQDGSGSTNDNGGTATGLGNLIVGYNELGNYAGDIRTGSHNLIVSAQNNYTAYGGAVFGLNNSITGTFASVTGGDSNSASGLNASITGGSGSLASGDYAAITGGVSNVADGNYAFVGGGYQNSADGLSASITGGFLNIAGGQASSVTGGANNQAVGDFSSIIGGSLNTVYNDPNSSDLSSYGAILGGQSNNVGTEFGHFP